MSQKNIIAALRILFVLIWSGFVISAYYVVQKPLALQVIDHLLFTVWTLVVTSMLLVNALALGTFTIKLLVRDRADDVSMLLLAGGLGLGELGLLGFALAALGAATFEVLLGIQLLFLLWFIRLGIMADVFARIDELVIQLRTSASKVPGWMVVTVTVGMVLTFSLTLLPPVEAFDALLYHLTVPYLWLRDGGLRAYDMPPYWFPGIVEGAYVWGLGLGTDIVPQQLHFLWGVFTGLLLWNWSSTLWDDRTAWWVLLLLLSMPSLLLLASWAYTDLALSFFALAILFSLWQGRNIGHTSWWRLAAIFAGMAMGVKYTSAIIPVTAILLISIWTWKERKAWLTEIMWFSAISGLTGCIWYLRNLVWMENPFYPFVFGGRYWDSFRAALYAGAGTGAGWDLKAILTLPLTITLNYQDITAFDGDIGPLYLLALPMALWIILKRRNFEPAQQRALAVIGFFGLSSAIFWTYGYISSKNLWQARLLLPAILPFAIPASLGILSSRIFDARQIRVSFVVSGLAALAVLMNLLDLSLSVIYRNPLALATGIVSRESFMEQFQPDYASALQLVGQAPQNATIYSLFEPRSYGAARTIQPDSLLDNFLHDVFLYEHPDDIVEAWREEDYSHVLLNKRGAEFILSKPGEMEILNATMDLLQPVAAAPNGNFALYEIPTR
jgi:hypothetical protein